MKTTEVAEVGIKTLCPEDYFQRMLIREREKTEKSGSQFMLVLVDVGELFNYKWGEKDVLLQNTIQALNASTREVDMTGWYLYNSLIGIICPGFYKPEKGIVIEKIRRKLEASLEPHEAIGIKIYSVFYSNIEEPMPVF
jgi:hypothetical protein